MVEQRAYTRIKTKAMLVSISNSSLKKPITGFIRDISAGGLKIQKISSMAQVQSGEYECQFVLPMGKIISRVELVNSGSEMDKLNDLFIRMRFVNINNADREKIISFVQQNIGKEMEPVLTM